MIVLIPEMCLIRVGYAMFTDKDYTRFVQKTTGEEMIPAFALVYWMKVFDRIYSNYEHHLYHTHI